MNANDFKQASCSKPGCWARETFKDAGITVNMGAGWNAFLIDDHFANKHRCLGKTRSRKAGKAGTRAGGFCDAIGVPDQNPNCRYRLLEAKAGGMSSTAAEQLQRGADYLEALLGDCRKVRLSAEIYTDSLPAVTNRRRSHIKFSGGRIKVPIDVFSA